MTARLVECWPPKWRLVTNTYHGLSLIITYTLRRNRPPRDRASDKPGSIERVAARPFAVRTPSLVAGLLGVLLMLCRDSFGWSRDRGAVYSTLISCWPCRPRRFATVRKCASIHFPYLMRSS